MANSSLTDAELREIYLKTGHPDGSSILQKRVALPKSIVKGDWFGYSFLFAYVSIVLSIPCYAGFWYIGDRNKTLNGLQASTADTFLRMAAAKEAPLTLQNVITTLSGCREVESTTESKSLRALDVLDAYRDLSMEAKPAILECSGVSDLCVILLTMLASIDCRTALANAFSQTNCFI